MERDEERSLSSCARKQRHNSSTSWGLNLSDLKPDTKTTTLPRFHSERLNKIELMIPFHEPFWYEKFHQRFPRAFNCSHERRPSIDGLCVDFCSAFKQQLNKIYLPRVTRMMQWTPLEIIFGVDVRAGRKQSDAFNMAVWENKQLQVEINKQVTVTTKLTNGSWFSLRLSSSGCTREVAKPARSVRVARGDSLERL